MTSFALQKCAGYLVMPAGLFWLALLALCVVCLLKTQHRRLGYVLLVFFGFYSLMGNFQLGQHLIASLEGRIAPLPHGSEPFDAICVLGGGSLPDPWGEPQLGQAGDRIAAAARLWHAGRARVLVTSGVSADGKAMGIDTRTLWLRMGVPQESILVIPMPCRITRDEIAAIRSLKDQHSWKRVAIVSSAWHLPRAMALARRAGLEATPIGSDWWSMRRVPQGCSWIPQAEGFELVQQACWEYLGRWIGR